MLSRKRVLEEPLIPSMSGLYIKQKWSGDSDCPNAQIKRKELNHQVSITSFNASSEWFSKTNTKADSQGIWVFSPFLLPNKWPWANPFNFTEYQFLHSQRKGIRLKKKKKRLDYILSTKGKKRMYKDYPNMVLFSKKLLYFKPKVSDLAQWVIHLSCCEAYFLLLMIKKAILPLFTYI